MVALTRNEIMMTSGCGSVVADDAMVGNYLPQFLRDNGTTGVHRLALFQCGNVQAIEFHNSAIWKGSAHPDDWSTLMEELDGYGDA